MRFKLFLRGVTLIEVLISLGIIFVLWSIVLFGFTTLNEKQALDKDNLLVMTVMSEARALTLSSKNDTTYGVHLSEFKVTLFSGSSYNSSDPNNKTADLSAHSRVAGHVLAGGGSDIIFQRLTGATSQNGTITITLRFNESRTKTITIYGTGTIESN